ncbi:hypothetical protein QM716_14810 [Rhodococcus sp. IEGM 1409]|uniref:hypothetical protein n=1 Tax=Rhodococcus sp. IEGM 1409 TaxID=3047082 RepID=UPI0024B68955|nr:hypothetical protein [Rhodococcus sp. IEGM 1409]MDI9901127.1 hypothetical protein [Rhodococcus sp. IEGM 1409]
MTTNMSNEQVVYEAMLLPGDEPERLSASWFKAVALYAAASVVGFIYIVIPMTMFVLPLVESVVRALVISLALFLSAILAIRMVLRRILFVRRIKSGKRRVNR